MAYMEICKFFAIGLLLLNQLPISIGANGNLFAEYIGALFENVTFSNVPINPAVEFHFILSFAIDYTTESGSPVPTDGNFNIFWDNGNLSPEAVEAIKAQHPNVKVALSVGGDSVDNQPAEFKPSSVSSWVDNAVSSLSKIIEEYHLDGIDIDYEHFQADNDTFAECIGQLITRLKQNNAISFASIAPFDDQEVQSHYLALWNKYGDAIDYVNFQFYAYDASTTISEFIQYYNTQASQYSGGKILVSFITETGGGAGLSPENGFFDACNMLKQNGELEGIFVWCADSSKSNDFKYDTQSQALLAS
jgi:hypothetical protein